jgi:hypothetical protein
MGKITKLKNKSKITIRVSDGGRNIIAPFLFHCYTFNNYYESFFGDIAPKAL